MYGTVEAIRCSLPGALRDHHLAQSCAVASWYWGTSARSCGGQGRQLLQGGARAALLAARWAQRQEGRPRGRLPGAHGQHRHAGGPTSRYSCSTLARSISCCGSWSLYCSRMSCAISAASCSALAAASCGGGGGGASTLSVRAASRVWLAGW
jgi:hypothetical protein